MRLRKYQQEQQDKNRLTTRPVGNIAPPDFKDGKIQCRLCDEIADEDYIDQDVYICVRCADLIANIHYSDCGNSTFGFATWSREDIIGKSNYRKPIKQSTRTKVFERDLYRCKNCDSAINLCVDHIHPVSKGGSNNLTNLQTLCTSCNASKGTKTMNEWLEVASEQIQR